MSYLYCAPSLFELQQHKTCQKIYIITLLRQANLQCEVQQAYPPRHWNINRIMYRITAKKRFKHFCVADLDQNVAVRDADEETF